MSQDSGVSLATRNRVRMVFKLTVFGTPAPAGSKRLVPLGGKAGGRNIVIDASKRSAPWKKEIQQEAGRAMLGRPLLEGPIAARFTFYVRRPKGHFGSGRNATTLKPSAPRHPMSKPDLLKLTRAVEDALSGKVYRDDSQIVSEVLKKRYGTPERVEIEIFIAEES